MPRSAYLGIGLLSFVLLAGQLVLTRIFSVVFWYHFVFLVVSMVMLGLAAGGSFVYALPGWFTAEKALRRVALLSAASGVLLFAAIVIVLALPANPLGAESNAPGVRAALVTLSLLPSFVVAGIAVAALFQAFPRAVPSLYAADLLGAGLGAVGALALMWRLSGPSLGLLLGALLVGAGALFASAGGRARLRSRLALLCACLLVASLANDGLEVVRVRHTRTYSLGSSEARARLLHERWSPIAYLAVFDRYLFPTPLQPNFVGWGVGTKFSGTAPASYHLLQDAVGGTVVTLWDGNVDHVSHLDYDVTALPFHVRRFDDVLIVGPGGGRDVLTALRGRARKIVAVEMNPDMIDLMTNELQEASGGLYLRPDVEPVTAEARSWLTRSSRSFDLIQISMIDSWAATAAGAMVFAENNLYTVEAFDLYLDRLTPDGVVSVSRWFKPITVPGQTLKVVSIAAEALRRRGVEDPSRHVMVARGGILGTVLVSKRPFSAEDQAAALAAIDRYGFELIYAAGNADNHPEFEGLLTPGNVEAYLATQPIDLRPVDDDRPFFFIFSKGLLSPLPSQYAQYGMALQLLAWLVVVMALLGALLVIGPVLLRARLAGGPALELRRALRPLLYFFGLGAGFILVELTLIQRFIVYLGHPTYAATVVLTTLLVSLGLGSALVDRQPVATSLARQRGHAVLGVAVVLAVALAGPALTRATQGEPLLLRASLAALLLTLVGVPLGTLLPSGMRRLVASEREALVPWAWAVNGVAGVLFSAMALLLAIHLGYTACLLIGVAFYGLSLLSVPGRAEAHAGEPWRDVSPAR